jgi:competence ComEA-like helix-hairpin-helix protein
MLKASNNKKLYSLLILVIAALLYDVADSENPFREPDFATQQCIYQIIENGHETGIVSFDKPQKLATILEAKNLNSRSGTGDQLIPCNHCLKLDDKEITIIKIHGQLLIAVGLPLDLNLADQEDLMAVPGIGQHLADRIVDYRNKNGLFQSVHDLSKVKGIGKKKSNLFIKYLQVEEH